MLSIKYDGKDVLFDGIEIRIARVRAELRLGDLSTQTGIQTSELSRYERNRQVPSEHHLVKLLAFAPLCVKAHDGV